MIVCGQEMTNPVMELEMDTDSGDLIVKRNGSYSAIVANTVNWMLDHGTCREGTACFYRNDDNTNACAAGMYMSDETFKLLRYDGRDGAYIGSLLGVTVSSKDNDFLYLLQQFHDKYGTADQQGAIHDLNVFLVRNGEEYRV